MANPNIVSTTSILAKVNTYLLTTNHFASALENGASSNKILKINTITACNVSNSDTAVRIVSRTLTGNTNDFRIVNEINVPKQTTLVCLSTDTPIYLVENQRILSKASVNNAIQLSISYEEIS